MRIRSIKPEFWASDDIAALPWDARLIFIGLWSYVDDNGVGRDNTKLIAADLFPLEDDPRETLATVSRGLLALFSTGLISRYEVAGKAFLHITNWNKHQRIDKPNKERYPLPTRADAIIRDTLATPSRDSSDTLAPGTEEQGNRGTEEVKTSSPSVRVVDDFDEFWDAYPRKVGKGEALKAYTKARRKASADELLAAVAVLVRAYRNEDPKFIPHPTTWLNGERWTDDPAAIRPAGSPADDSDRRKASIFTAALERGEARERENVYRLEIGQ